MPPFGRLAALIVSSSDRERARSAAHNVARLSPTASGVRLLGPAEAPIALLRSRYRFRLLVKGEPRVDMQAYLRALRAAVGPLGKDVRMRVDVDPHAFFLTSALARAGRAFFPFSLAPVPRLSAVPASVSDARLLPAPFTFARRAADFLQKSLRLRAEAKA